MRSPFADQKCILLLIFSNDNKTLLTKGDYQNIIECFSNYTYFSCQFTDNSTWPEIVTRSILSISSASTIPTNLSAEPLVDHIIAPFSKNEIDLFGEKFGLKNEIAKRNSKFTRKVEYLNNSYIHKIDCYRLFRKTTGRNQQSINVLSTSITRHLAQVFPMNN